MANNYTEGSAALKLSTKAQVVRVKKMLKVYDKEREEDGENVGFVTETIHTDEGLGLYIHHDDGLDADSVASFVQRVYDELNLEGYFRMTFAHTCDKPRVDEFGGGAVVVRAHKPQLWLSTDDLSPGSGLFKFLEEKQ